MQHAEKISITVTPEMMRALRASVEAGEYASTSEAIRDALRIWDRERREHEERIAAIRSRIRKSLDDPRPDLSSAKVDSKLEHIFTSAKKRK
ncbi:MAG TPA: ribbon-helix-helix protein, CopG family [Rhizobiaceae bacterium]|nr:ribbon-helix-helix protein, CopG family [Rhizobiaceae bacterium]